MDNLTKKRTKDTLHHSDCVIKSVKYHTTAKIFSLLMSAVMTFAVIGCTKEDANGDNRNGNSDSTAVAIPDEANVVIIDDVTYPIDVEMIESLLIQLALSPQHEVKHYAPDLEAILSMPLIDKSDEEINDEQARMNYYRDVL